MAGLHLDPATRDLVLDGDQAAVIDDPRTELVLALGVELDTFHGDPDQGSRIPSLIKGLPPVDARRAVESAATEAVARLESQGLVELREALYDPADNVVTVDTDSLTGLELDLG